jgi:hypothetical protein
MASENYFNLYFSDEKIRLTILTNVCRMLITRGFMDSEKYKFVPKNKESKSSIVEQPSSQDKIDNTLFLPFIEARVDNNIYTIPLDTPYRDEKENKSEATVDFDGSSVVIKIIPQIVKDVSNSPILNDFLKTYNGYHKIVIFDGIAPKVYTTINKKKNVEVFERDALMIDLMSHVEAPIKCEFIDLKDIDYITNPKISKIHENDPLCRYFNGKVGMIMRIVRQSQNNSKEIGYRKVIEPKFLVK